MMHNYRRFRVLLEAKRAEIVHHMFRRRSALRIDEGGDLLDRLLGAKERERAVCELERCATKIQQIDGALQRIDEGTFGVCARCNLMIPIARLKAIPWAHLCISCQEHADRGEFAQRGDYPPAHAA